jgi:type I restriction enzyme S subunit
MNNYIAASSYCNKIFDGTHDTPKPVANGYPLITSKNILGGLLN